MSWRQRADCLAFGSDWFDLPLPEQHATCVGCPVRGDCIGEAVQTLYRDRYETWGGVYFDGHPETVYRNACANCDRVFYTKESPGETCSHKCRKNLWKRRARGETLTATSTVLHVDRNTCIECGTEFDHEDIRVITCSKECWTIRDTRRRQQISRRPRRRQLVDA